MPDGQRDIMQLTEVLRDAISVQEIVRGLRGRDREPIENALRKLLEKGDGERDIMQLIDKERKLDPDIYRAIDHLLGNRSSYLRALVKLANERHDWRKLPIPSSF